MYQTQWIPYWVLIETKRNLVIFSGELTMLKMFLLERGESLWKTDKNICLLWSLGMFSCLYWAFLFYRSLGPAAVKIIRILMDIAFIWSSCSKYSIDSSKSQDLLSLVKAVETHAYLPEFFYQHLERDLQDLSRHTGQNFEETVFLIHIVLKSLMETAKIHCKYGKIRTLFSWMTPQTHHTHTSTLLETLLLLIMMSKVIVKWSTIRLRPEPD